jgi:K+-transporting ATPase ATPase A chain
MKMASLVILLPSMGVLIATAWACRAGPGLAGILNPGPHGFSEILYAYSSASNNNGSAFAGLTANTPFYDGLLGICMLLGRYGVAIPTLALAGSLAAKKKVPAGAGTLPTHTPLFVFLLASIVMLVGALTFLPALALGPGIEHIQMLFPGGAR